ncbi:zinc-binding dehydrogenase [Propionibacteriaceae bacterium Y1923]|uniref:zinc-binding dehydrogenase n=1 Tax=Aestuariimicrobium sp. Y1814 TaxID=3418742 RepID=UPI003C239166
MRALSLTETLKATDMVVTDLPTPEPGPGEVRIKVAAVGLNPVDYKVAGGKSPGDVLGLDIAGTVDVLGEGVDGFALGDRVALHNDLGRPGGLAEFVVVAADVLARVPDGVTFVAAAALPCAGMTAYQSVNRRLHAGAGDTVLVTAAAGGVGGFAVQLAHLAGARVIGTASGANREVVLALGADEVIDYRTEDIPTRVRELTGGVGVNGAIDTISSDSATQNLSLLTFGGGLVAIQGRPDWDVVPPFTTAPSVHEISLGAAHQHGDARARAELRLMLEELLALVDAGRLDPRVVEVVPFEQAPRAYGVLADGHVAGKLVVEL